MKTHHGGCHCGAVKYEVNADIKDALECNCSHCSAKGFLLTFVPASQFKLLQGEDNLTSYQFNKKHINHLFCKTCGVEAFARGSAPDGSETVAINIRTLDNVDMDTIERKPYDGKNA